MQQFLCVFGEKKKQVKKIRVRNSPRSSYTHDLCRVSSFLEAEAQVVLEGG